MDLTKKKGGIFVQNKPGYMTTFRERLSFWTYFIGQNVYYNLTAIFLATYLLMQGVDEWKVSLVLLVVKVWDAINDPIFGYIFDKVKFKNGQKSLPWIRISVALIPIVTIALFAIPKGLSDTGKLVWMAISYMLWDTVYTLTDVPAYSMLNTMTDNQDERRTLLSINRVFSGAGYLICFVGYPLLISRAIAMSTTLAVAILAIFSALTMLPLCLFCKERNYHPEEEGDAFTPLQMMRYLKQNKYLLIFYGGYCATDALKTFNAVSLFASFYLFGDELFGTIVTMLSMVPGAIIALFMPAIFRKWDKMKVLIFCNIASVILGFAIFFAGWENKTLFMVLSVIRCIPLNICGILYFMFTPDCAEYGQYRSGISAKGITFAIQTFSVKITGAVSSALAIALLGVFRWVEVEADEFSELVKLAEAGFRQPAQALNGLWIVYALVPVIGMLISTFFFMAYKLRDKDVQIMAKCNAGEITREQARAQLSREY